MKSGINKKIAVIEGDGVGPEVTQQSVRVLKAVAEQHGHQFDFMYGLMGAAAIDKTGVPLPDETIQTCLESDAVLFGAIGDPKYDHDPHAKVRPEQGLLKLRKSLELFASIRPVKTYSALHHLSPLKSKKIEGTDFIIYRELTSGIYFGKKESGEGYAIDECIYRTEEIERIAKLAFEHARLRNKKLTLIDKANILETSRLWRKVVQELAEQYKDIAVNYLFVDNAAMQLLLNPKQFDIILTENMFGDILSDEASVLTGSLGMLPSASVGNKIALFEPIHGSYHKAAGKNIANPLGSILSAAMMLDHFKLYEEAAFVREAVNWTLQHGFVTKDVDVVNAYTTTAIGDLISDYVEGKIPGSSKNENINLRKSTII